MNGPRLLRRKEAAAYIRDRYGIPCAESTLAKLAVIGGGPEITYCGRFPCHTEAALDAWTESRMSKARTTSERRRPLVAAE